MIYERQTGEIAEEQVYGNNGMNFLYNTTLGGICAAFLRLPVVSGIYGSIQKSKSSKNKIKRLIENYNMGFYQYDEYTSFNDFITRKENRIFEQNPDILISPADSCLLVKTVENDVMFSMKGKDYTVSRFLKDEKLAEEYNGGLCLIFRLRVYDYHRFCFPDGGVIKSEKRINGFLDSVNAAKTGKFVLSSNYRKISVLNTSNFGEIIFAEIGAMLVGRIVYTNSGLSFCKGGEKGYFEFGGSSIVMLLKKDIVKIDNDILAYSEKSIETKVKYGERIAIKRV